MPRSRDIQKQQIGQPALQPSIRAETLGDLECIATGSGLNRPGIKMPEFLPSDSEIWFSILDKALKENRITNDTAKFTYAVTAISLKYDIKVRNIILNPSEDCAC